MALRRASTSGLPRPHSRHPHPIVLEHSLNVRDYVKPPVPDTYPGNVVSFSCVETSLDRLLAPDSLSEHAVAVRAAVNKWRSWSMIKDTMDYVASFTDRFGIQFNPDIIKGIDALVTNWRVVSAYQTWDFGFGPLQALRWATPVFDGYMFSLPQRPKVWRFTLAWRRAAWQGCFKTRSWPSGLK